MKEWTEFFKALPSILLVVIMLAVAFWGYGEWKNINQKLDDTTKTIQGLTDTTTKIENGISAISTSKVSKEELDSSVDEKIKDMLNKYDLTPVEGVSGTGRVKRNTDRSSGIKIDKQYYTDIYWPPDQSGARIKIASSMFDTDSKDFTNTTYPVRFKLDIVTAIDENNNEAVFATLMAYGDTTEYSIELSEVKSVKTYPKDKKWRLAPHIDAGGSIKLNSNPQIGADIGISPFAYGLTKDDNLVRVPRIAIGGSEDELWIEVQGSYNFAQHIPVFSDIWGSAGVCFDQEGNWGACISITSTF